LHRIIQWTAEVVEAKAICKVNHPVLMQLSQISTLRTPSGVHYAGE
jgi:hypothetical protein